MSNDSIWPAIRRAASVALVSVFTLSAGQPGGAHVVNLDEVRQEVAGAAETRRAAQQRLDKALSSPRLAGALSHAGIDAKNVQASAAGLSDADAARLSARLAAAEADLAAGRITDRDLLLILVGIACLILIIVAVR